MRLWGSFRGKLDSARANRILVVVRFAEQR